MDPVIALALAKVGAAAVLGLAAIGSALGTGTAGLAAVGAWKRCYALEKPVPFILVTFVGAPLSQTIYGMILMNTVVRVATERATEGDVGSWPAALAVGLLGGAAMGVLVHGVRLNTLEFAGHLGLPWTGHAYRPFAHHASGAGEGDL